MRRYPVACEERDVLSTRRHPSDDYFLSAWIFRSTRESNHRTIARAAGEIDSGMLRQNPECQEKVARRALIDAAHRYGEEPHPEFNE